MEMILEVILAIFAVLGSIFQAFSFVLGLIVLGTIITVIVDDTDKKKKAK